LESCAAAQNGPIRPLDTPVFIGILFRSATGGGFQRHLETVTGRRDLK
jgi:hypothetical protein